ncbi:MAG: HAD family hydrolase, partial [Symbiobacteriaceae bacterium]|nr:HAD family hydrolase [Symbiobacteriaceae bacterium]
YTFDSLSRLITAGMNFTFASARRLKEAIRVLPGIALHQPVILQNGAMVYDMQRSEYSRVCYLPHDSVLAIIEIYKAHGTAGFLREFVDGEDHSYHDTFGQDEQPDFVNTRIERYRRQPGHKESFAELSPGFVVHTSLFDRYERLAPIRDEVAKLPGLSIVFYQDTYDLSMWLLEINSHEASKQTAVNFIRLTCGYERIIGFGDNLNDIPLLEACDIGIAVDNAKPEVRAAANQICDSNNDDGVIKWIEAYVAQNGSIMP